MTVLDASALLAYLRDEQGADAVQEALAKPVDATLFFAGEATCQGHFGTVHGALMSGQRAAREVLNSS